MWGPVGLLGAFPLPSFALNFQNHGDLYPSNTPQHLPKAGWDAAVILLFYHHHHHESHSFQEFSLQPKTCLCFDSYLEAKRQLSNHNTQCRFGKLIYIVQLLQILQ